MQIDLNADRIAMRYPPVEVGLVGHADAVLTRLLPLLKRKNDRTFLARAQDTYQRWWDLIGEQAASSGTPMRPQVVTWELSKALPPDHAIVTGDAGTVTAWGGRLRLRRGMQYSFSGTCAPWAPRFLTPSAPSSPTPPAAPVIAFTGDGSMSMGMGELATLAQYNLPIKVVVLRNDSLALEVWEQTALLGNPQMGCELHPHRLRRRRPRLWPDGLSYREPVRRRRRVRRGHGPRRTVPDRAVTDPTEAPFGESLQPAHAQHIAQAFDKGEPSAAPWHATSCRRGGVSHSRRRFGSTTTNSPATADAACPRDVLRGGKAAGRSGTCEARRKAGLVMSWCTSPQRRTGGATRPRRSASPRSAQRISACAAEEIRYPVRRGLSVGVVCAEETVPVFEDLVHELPSRHPDGATVDTAR